MLTGVGHHDLSDLQQDGEATNRRGDENIDDGDDDVLEESVDDSDSERDAPAPSKEPHICLFCLVDLFLTRVSLLLCLLVSFHQVGSGPKEAPRSRQCTPSRSSPL